MITTPEKPKLTPWNYVAMYRDFVTALFTVEPVDGEVRQRNLLIRTRVAPSSRVIPEPRLSLFWPRRPMRLPMIARHSPDDGLAQLDAINLDMFSTYQSLVSKRTSSRKLSTIDTTKLYQV